VVVTVVDVNGAAINVVIMVVDVDVLTEDELGGTNVTTTIEVTIVIEGTMTADKDEDEVAVVIEGTTTADKDKEGVGVTRTVAVAV